MLKVGNIKSNINNAKTIKSLYNLKEIMKFLDEKVKYDLIIYNKHLQNELGINIENYKAISKKYKIGGKNGKGKEYIKNTNKLIFEGEYLKGKRNGQGKEFYKNGKIIFEGEYSNGEKWNGNQYKIKENDKIEYEYIKGKPCRNFD